VLALVGCGGGSSQPAAVPHPSDLAAKIHGCYGYSATEVSMFAREEGDCTLWSDGHTVDIATFGAQQAQQSWLRVAQEFGGIYVTGSLWIAEVESQADAEQVEKDLGGTIH
jgi:hypothetical protein